MAYPKEFQEHLQKELKDIKDKGLYKNERVILSPQQAMIFVESPKVYQALRVLNFCANNYLGLADNPEIIEAAKISLDERGYGLSSVRFICGTQDLHKELEKKISEFLCLEDTILYSSCGAANEGLFEVLLGFDDAVISDALNHATIIDGVRLWQMIHKEKIDPKLLVEEVIFTKHHILKREGLKVAIMPENRVFKHSDMNDLEKHLKETQDKRVRLICTDGVFSMDGDIAKLDQICELAERYDAMVMVDDSHATGFVGKTGRGTHEYRDVMGKVDIITSTMGKALGGAAGGFTSSRKEIIELLRQRSRPYLFSNTVPPVIVAATIKVLDMLEKTTYLRDKLEENTKYFRKEITKLGFDIRPGTHPIVPIMLYEAKPAVELANGLLKEGIYVIAFSYPVVPKGAARIRVQISAAHSPEDLDFAIEKFDKVGRELGIIK